jgi:hypothetical protein
LGTTHLDSIYFGSFVPGLLNRLAQVDAGSTAVCAYDAENNPAEPDWLLLQELKGTEFPSEAFKSLDLPRAKPRLSRLFCTAK